MAALLSDGYQSLIKFDLISNVGGAVFREREVKPPDLDGGGPLDTTTMRNLVYRTRQPKKLIGQGSMACKIQWNTALYNNPRSFINKNSSAHMLFPDASGIDFWGWINKFAPTGLKEGEFAEAEMEVFLSNQDNDSTEQSITYVNPQDQNLFA